jgi:hypothetical protein
MKKKREASTCLRGSGFTQSDARTLLSKEATASKIVRILT